MSLTKLSAVAAPIAFAARSVFCEDFRQLPTSDARVYSAFADEVRSRTGTGIVLVSPLMVRLCLSTVLRPPTTSRLRRDHANYLSSEQLQLRPIRWRGD